jgi:hypothetical protein
LISGVTVHPIISVVYHKQDEQPPHKYGTTPPEITGKKGNNPDPQNEFEPVAENRTEDNMRASSPPQA